MCSSHCRSMKFRVMGEMINFAQMFITVKSEGEFEESQRALVGQGKQTENQQPKLSVSKFCGIQLGQKSCQCTHMARVTELIGKENPMSSCRALKARSLLMRSNRTLGITLMEDTLE